MGQKRKINTYEEYADFVLNNGKETAYYKEAPWMGYYVNLGKCEWRGTQPEVELTCKITEGQYRDLHNRIKRELDKCEILSNRILLDEYIRLVPGDDYDGCSTQACDIMSGVYFDMLEKRLKKIGFFD